MNLPRVFERLCLLRHENSGWSYSRGSPAAVEPTVLCSLALLALKRAGVVSPIEVQPIISSASSWVASVQDSQGGVGVSREQLQPFWPTALATLLWSASNHNAQACSEAVSWLLDSRGIAARAQNHATSVVGHDGSLVGWCWVPGTHSWVEPTALAVLALTACGHRDCERAQDGINLLEDRALPPGGWNYGNTTVYGTQLRPHPAPSGMALVALATANRTGVPSDAVGRAIEYLSRSIGSIRAPSSLAWAALGLRAWDALSPSTQYQLDRSVAVASDRDDAGWRLGLLTLAALPRGLAEFGLGERPVLEQTASDRLLARHQVATQSSS